MNLDIVWATIAVAAVAGSVSFALIATVERIVTFWHPSWRGPSNVNGGIELAHRIDLAHRFDL